MTSAAQEEVRLQELAALKVLDTPREERFDRIVRITQRLFDVPTVLVSLIDEDRQFNKARVGFGPLEVPRSQSFCDYAIRGSGPFVVEDLRAHEQFWDNPLVTGEPGVQFYAGQPLRTRSGSAVGTLCILDTKRRELTDTDLRTLRDLADIVEAELARTDELDRAVEVQRNLLPRSVPQLPGYEVDARCLPAAAVGGDFYDWFQVRDGFQLATADVMGKGVPAAIIASSVRSLFRGASRFNMLDAALNRVADDIEDDLADTATFVTLFAARIDVTSHQLTYVDAGHGMGGIVSHDGVRSELTSDGLPLGAPRLSPYRAGTVAMEPGDTFVCVSDGLLDLFPSFAEAGEALRQTVLSSVSAKEVVERMVTYGRRHGATDDVTVVVLRRNDA